MSEQTNRHPEPAEPTLLTRIESILLVAGGPVSVAALARACEVSRAHVVETLDELSQGRSGGIRVQLHDDQAQLVSAPESAEAVQRFLGTAKPPPLSRSALETLAVVAYHQPVTRAEVESARGVNSDRALRALLVRGLVEERGQRALLGRPMEYGTGFAFLEYFGLTSLADLPPLPDLTEPDVPAEAIGLRRRPVPDGEKKEDAP